MIENGDSISPFLCGYIMSLPRIFVSTTSLQTKQELILDAAASQHILQARRLRAKDQLIVFNGTGGEFQAHVTAVERGLAVVFLDSFIHCDKESPLKVHLGQATSRGEKMDFTIQKAVELGVTTITPLFTTYCNVKLEAERLTNKIRHWQAVAVGAAEQSGRARVPQVFSSQSLTKWCEAPRSGLKVVFTPDAKTKLSDIKEQLQEVTILVGPEGGLSDDEVVLAVQNQFLPVSLGPRILRTETAALTAVSIIQSMWGDL